MKTCCGQTFDLREYSAHLDKEHRPHMDISHTVRGGSWRSLARYVRAAIRDWLAPGFDWGSLGLRLAQDAGDPDFESLLKTEPYSEDASWAVNAWLSAKASDPMVPETVLTSAAERIEELEYVLRTIGGVARTASVRLAGKPEAMVEMLQGIAGFARETLDPCKPWCAMASGHEGACCADEVHDE